MTDAPLVVAALVDRVALFDQGARPVEVVRPQRTDPQPMEHHGLAVFIPELLVQRKTLFCQPF